MHALLAQATAQPRHVACPTLTKLWQGCLDEVCATSDAGDRPAKLLARATLIGKVEEVDEATAADAAQRHMELHPFGVGVDEPRDSDLYLRLNAETCFYVGGMGGNSQVSPHVCTQRRQQSALPSPMLCLKRCVCLSCCAAACRLHSIPLQKPWWLLLGAPIRLLALDGQHACD